MQSLDNVPDPDNYRPVKRIRQACQNCRRKKARCTGERPECAFCVRLGQACFYSDEDSPMAASLTNSMANGKKVDFARQNGTESKDLMARMSILEDQMSELTQTVRSFERTISSSLSQLTRALTSNNALATNPPMNPAQMVDATQMSPYGSLPPQEIIIAAADLYFRYCHNQPYSLFHEATFRQRIQLNELPMHLLFAVLASTVRYSTDPFFEDKDAAVSAYAHQSWRSIVMPWNGIQSDAELSTVQTILLLAIIDYTDGRTQASWIKVGLAIRLAQDFRLMLEPDQNMSSVQQEERRRVFWSFYLADKLVSCGREKPAAILDDHCRLQLPEDEDLWRQGHPQLAPTLEQLTSGQSESALPSLSPFASTVVMASLLGRCAQYALGEQEEQTPGGKMSPWNPASKYSSIRSILLQHEAELGLSDGLSRKITESCMGADHTVDQHRAAPLVLSHALFFLCQCLLYHPFLLKQRLSRTGQRTPQSFLTQTFDSCRLAATAMSRLMGDVKSLCCETLNTNYDPFYGYCTMVAGTIHTMFFRATDPTVRDMALTSFEASMANLQEMAYFWKSCAMMRSRLEDFRANSDNYASLVNPAIQEVELSATDANDLIECLDYARMSTTQRRRSQSAADGLPTLSQLPSPFFEELANLLPLSYSRTATSMADYDTMFAPMPMHTFENTG